MKIKSKDIESVMPLMCWENGALISKFSDITFPFELELPEVYSLGTEDFDMLHSAFVRAAGCLPDYSIVHRQDWYFNLPFEAGTDASSFLSSSSDHHFSGRQILSHRAFLYITLSSERNMRQDSSTTVLCRTSIVPSDMQDQGRIDSFIDGVKQFRQILEQAGIGVRELSSEEMLGNQKNFGIIEKYISLSLGEGRVLEDIVTDHKDMMVGDKYTSCFSVSDLAQLPSEVSTFTRHDRFSSESFIFPVSFVHQIGFGLNFNHIYNHFLFIDSHRTTLAAIEKRGREQQSLSGISRENAINKQFNDSYLNEAIVHGRRSVRCAANVIVWDTDYPELLRKNGVVASKMSAMDCVANKTEGILPIVFWGGIPGCASQFPKDMTFLTFMEQACCLAGYEGNMRGGESGPGIRLCDRISGAPMHVDISDEPRVKGYIDNRNKFILGPSGSGKSFFTNHMVRSYYEHGTHVVIVDVGDSYYGLCKLINEETGGEDGIYYTYTEEHPIAFNPFYSKDSSYDVEKREQLSALIFCLWKNENELITKSEETHVATAINGYLGQVISGEVTPSFNTFYDYLCGEFRNHISESGVRSENFDIDDLIQVLRPYASGGMYDYLLNGSENIDLTAKRFIVFEIDNIKDHKTLFPVVTLILMDTFISKMRNQSLAGARKMILIEEAWKAISKSGTAEFIKYLYKTVRKHFGEAVVVTQEIEDIVGNDIVRNAIISNADCKILLDQRKYANRFDEIRNVLSLSQKECATALSVNRNIVRDGRAPYKEVFITLNGNRCAVYGVEVSRSEYLTYTTEKSEKACLLDLEKKHGSMRSAIEAYIQLNL